VDIRGVPTHVCPCGSELWRVQTIFKDYQVAMYFLDMECALCGSIATAPTLADMPEGYVPLEPLEEEDDYDW